MKTKLIRIAIFSFLIMAFFTISCNEEKIQQNPAPEIMTANEKQDVSTQARHGHWRFCIFEIERGRKISIGPGIPRCVSWLSGICSIRIVDCIYILQNPCLYFPCDFPLPDPWEIYEILDPLKIPDIRKIVDVKVDPEINVLPFPVNENVVGLQFYEPVKEVLDEKVMVLENDLELDPEFAKENGLAGNMVPAGKYPVLFNEKTKNYNVLVSVK